MSKENMAGFLEALGKDQKLLAKFNHLNLAGGNAGALVSFAGEAGFVITESDLKEAVLRFQTEKLTDDDLGNVSAGVGPLPSPPADVPGPATVISSPANGAQQALQTLQQQAEQAMQDAQQAQQDIQQLMQ